MNKCKWVQHSDNKEFYDVCCLVDYKRYKKLDYKYCPYCGKEIELLEYEKNKQKI